MLGSTGATPPGPATSSASSIDVALVRDQRQGDPVADADPGPLDVDGIGLPREVLEKVYWKNAAKLLGIADPPAAK